MLKLITDTSNDFRSATSFDQDRIFDERVSTQARMRRTDRESARSRKSPSIKAGTQRNQNARPATTSFEPPTNPSDYRVEGLEQWNGRVLEVTLENFIAELVEDGGSVPLIADFNRSELMDEELSVGDALYVTVRTVQQHRGGTQTTRSVRLRRLGRWTQEEVSAQRERGRQRLADLGDFSD